MYEGGKYENKKRFNKQKKSIYSKEDNRSSNEDDNGNDTRELLFMVLDNELENENPNGEVNVEVEVDVDYEGELIRALNDLIEEIKKNIQLKELIIDQKVQLEEARKIEEDLIGHLKYKEIICDKLEAQIVTLRK